MDRVIGLLPRVRTYILPTPFLPPSLAGSLASTGTSQMGGHMPHSGPITYLVINGETETQRGRVNPQAQLEMTESGI